jgi:ribosomal-protein-alanine N-acetyltransferase
VRKGARDSPLNPHIRIASEDDLDALLSLEKICFKEETFQKKQIKYLLLKAKSVILVTENKGKIVGSIIILLRQTILNARVYSLNVHPEYRRLGIASSLMDFGMDILRKRGYKNITLEVGINNQAAQNLYMSKGFVVDKILYNYYKNDDDALHLTRKL